MVEKEAKLISNSNEVFGISNLRAIATLSVIVLHVSAIPVIDEFNNITRLDNNYNWHIGNLFDSLVRFCVPIFVMISGALLIPNTSSVEVFIKRRMKRILLPFVFWSIIYSFFNLCLKVFHKSNLGFGETFRIFISDFFSGPSVHFWYVYMIIGLYLFIPIISPWVRNANNSEILVFLLIWFITIILNQFEPFDNQIAFKFEYFTGYIGYLILGYFLSSRLNKKHTSIVVSILLFLFGYIITVIGTFKFSQAEGRLSEFWYNYLTVNVCAMSIGVFLIFRYHLKLSGKTWFTFKGLLDKYGFGIYLVHVLVLHLMSFLGLNYKFIAPYISIPLISLLCLVFSIIIIHLLNKLPYGRHFAG